VPAEVERYSRLVEFGKMVADRPLSARAWDVGPVGTLGLIERVDSCVQVGRRFCSGMVPIVRGSPLWRPRCGTR
jgi:hypothetical protein